MKTGRRGRLSSEHLRYIGEHFGRKRTELIAEYVERSPDSVREHAQTMFKPRTGAWTEAENTALAAALGRADLVDIALYLGRSEDAVRERVAFLAARARSAQPLDRVETADLRVRYGRMTEEEVRAAFGRTLAVIEPVVRHYHLRKDKRWAARLGEKTTMPRWTDAEIVTLKKLYPTRNAVEVAAIMKRSLKSVMSKANRLGLTKTEERLAAMGRENVRHRQKR